MTADLVHRLTPFLALGLNLVLLGAALTADRKSPRNRVFACLVSALGIWNFGVLGLRSAADPATAVAWERFLHIGVIPIPVLFYHYVLLFLDAPRRRASLMVGYVGYALCGVFLVVSPTTAFMSGVRDTPWGFVPAAGPLYGLFFVYFQFYLVAGILLLVRAYRSVQSSFRKNRVLLVLTGSVVSFVGGAVDLVRFIFGWEWLYPPGIPSNAVFALALGVALVRYRLLDLGLLAKRSALYLLTTMALAPVILAGLYAVDYLAPHGLAPAGAVPTHIQYAVALLLALTVALPLLRKLEDGLDRLIFERQHGVRDALVALSKEIVSILDIQRLCDAVTQGLVTRVPVMHASVDLYEPSAHGFVEFSRANSGAEETVRPVPIDEGLARMLEVTGRTFVVEEAAFQAIDEPWPRSTISALEAARVELLVPLFLEGRLTAVLVVGEKLSGEIFDPREIELLETLMGEAAIALKNSRLYEDLKRQMVDLERAQQQLFQSAKLAAIGELAASVAHELNNPLTVILGNTDILTQENPPGSVQDKLSDIGTAAHRAFKISRELLDFARRREPKREPLDVHNVVARSLELLKPKLGAARIDAQVVFDPAVPPILGDSDQLFQVFVNLMTNAADAMPGGGTLTVRTELRQEEGKRFVAVSVTDTGAGMDEKQLALIFEPFYTTKPEGQGTGLGLSISLGIVKRHGGLIEAQSKPGKGTTMVVTLPVPS